MTQELFQATVRYQPGLATIDLQGELTGQADQTLKTAYAEAESHHQAVILLNFGKVDHINSLGVGLIVDLLSQALRSQRTLKACGLKPYHRKILMLVGLTGFMEIIPDEADPGAIT
jgi:anti-sigma B factor antagonist